MNINELIKKLPGSWKELKLKDYQKLTTSLISNQEEFAGIDNTIQVISKLTDVPVEQLEDLPYYQVAACAERLTFLQTLPERDKSFEVGFKKLEEISYDDFVQYVTNSHQANTDILPLFKMIVKDKEMNIDEMNTEEVLQGFFLLRKHLKKFTSNLIWRSRMKLMKQATARMLQPFKVKIKR